MKYFYSVKIVKFQHIHFWLRGLLARHSLLYPYPHLYMVSYVCPLFNICADIPELLLLVLINYKCSLYLGILCLSALHILWGHLTFHLVDAAFFLTIWLLVGVFHYVCIVFFVVNPIFILVSLNIFFAFPSLFSLWT
jgi:hypothetical protein